MHLFEANAVLGLLAAALWGGGDFAGSIAVKRAGGAIRGALSVILIGHLLSLAVVSALATHAGDTFPHGAPLWWGICGGAISSIALVAFYIALASGHMGSAAAVSGLLCAAVPAIVSGVTEGAPGWRRLLGFALAGAAIWLIASASTHGETASRRAVVLATLSGLGFGIYFVSLKLAGTAGVLWPMGSARIGSAATAAVLLAGMTFLSRGAASGSENGHRMKTLIWIVGGAALDTCGNLSFLAATRAGRLDVAAVLASIYPASTILLAAAVLKERTSTRQRWGMLLALPAVVLITL
ncbi:DMT family transporter [Terriglobus roseus]|uniref:EamA-like transporter family protein n=1 Tax=Terriglobus roseus TaxID=392734 RepID=A0A1H4QTW1_9BACT|nr:DMT family transporter [Terriglobus roseus]SEC23106.1 EamA-like transporter family protein [Terriglobus roseus]